MVFETHEHEQKWTAADVPDQSGRVAVVTGVQHRHRLRGRRRARPARRPRRGRGRNLDKGKDAVDKIARSHPGADVTLQALDLALAGESVRSAADDLRGRITRIDLLINNAGVMYPPKQTTSDGFELQFGTNHLGHFALTGLLLDSLLPVDGSRVVVVGSIAHRIQAGIHFDDLQWERSYNRVAAYGQSKLANLMFTYELQRRLAAKKRADNSRRRPPRPLQHRADAPHPRRRAARRRAARRAWSPTGRRSARWPRCGPRPIPACRAASTTGPVGLPGTRRPSGSGARPASSRTTSPCSERLWTVSEELTGVTFPAVLMRSVDEHRQVVAGLITRTTAGHPAARRGAGPGARRRRGRPAVAARLRQLGDGRLRRHRRRHRDATAEHPVRLPVAEDIPAGRTDIPTTAPPGPRTGS